MCSWFFKPAVKTQAAAEEPASAAAAEAPVVAADAASIPVLERLNLQFCKLSELDINAQQLKRITSKFKKSVEENSTAVLWIKDSVLKKIPDENWERFCASVNKNKELKLALNILKQVRNPEESLEDWCSIEPDEGSSSPAPNLPGI
jgi:pyruvate formate-lyase activating enzyme-like uncharacterized protein